MRGAFLELAQSEHVTHRFEAWSLELLSREIGADAAFFSVKGEEAAANVIGIDAVSMARAVRRGNEYELELMPVMRAALAARGVAVDTDVLGESAVRRTKYFREVAARVKGRHSLLAYLSWRGQTRAAIMLGRSGVGFSPSELARVEAILPELAAARASYGWPFAEAALRPPAQTGLIARFASKQRLLAAVATPRGRLGVRDRNGFREMVALEGERELVWTRAKLSQPSESGFPYVELFHVAAALAPQRRRALFIGAGGAVAVRQFARTYPGIAIDLVEIEPRVIELAREWFGLASIPGVTLHVADGVEFVQRASSARWDVIIVDAYADGFVEAFGSRPFFAAARRCLTARGTIALNLIDRLDETGGISAILAASASELAAPRILPVIDPEQAYDASALRNVVIIWRSR
jgi:spermine/spermidine synthase